MRRFWPILILLAVLLGALLYPHPRVERRGPSPVQPPPAPSPAPTRFVPEVPRVSIEKPTPPPVAAPKTEKSAVLTGQVLNAGGLPVEGAEVTLVTAGAHRDAFRDGDERPEPPLVTRTDTEGQFSFDHASPGQKRIIARHKDHAPGWSDQFLLVDKDHKLVTLPRPAALFGGVDPPGATLTAAYLIPDFFERGQRFASVTATADASGAYRLSNLPPQFSFRVRVEAPGFRKETFGPFTLAPGDERRDFTLDRGATLSGVVRTQAGEPVAGAEVMFFDGKAMTDAQGQFALRGLEDREGMLMISREGHTTITRNNVRPGAVEVTLPRAMQVCGRVEGGGGLFLCYSVGAARYRTRLGPSGAFDLTQVPPGKVRLEVEDENNRFWGKGVEVEGPEGGRIEDVLIRIR